MYQTTDAYLRTMALPNRQRYRLGGEIGGFEFNDDNVLEDSVFINNQACGSSDVSLGGVNIGTFSAVFVGIPIPRGKWEGKLIENLKIEFLTDEGEWEAIPFQPFTIKKAQHTANGVEIEASDAMAKFDRGAAFSTTNGMPYGIMQYLCERDKVPLGMTQEEVEALPNGSEMLGLFPENDIETDRDIIYWLAQTLGCFATIDRTGALVFRRFTTSVAGNKGADVRFEGGSYSDFETRYTGISVVNIAEMTTSYYGAEIDDGLTMNLGSNPFLQYGTNEKKEQMRRAILDEINKISFTPFEVETVPDPAIDLGDILTFPDYTGAGVRGCVMAYELNYKNSLTIEGFGSNPSLANAKSKADKDISGLMSQAMADELIYFTYLNAKDHEITTEQQIITLSVTNTKNTMVEFWFEIKMDVKVDPDAIAALIRFRYMLNDIEEIYRPVETINADGTYTLNFHYYWNLETVLQHRVKIFMEVLNGTATIATGDIHALLKGQGMTEGKAWDGLIEVEEAFSLTQDIEIGISFEEGGITTTAIVPEQITASDAFELTSEFDYTINFAEEVSVITRAEVFQLITESGARLITEAGDPIITDAEGG